MIDTIEFIEKCNLTGARITNCYCSSTDRLHADLWLTDDEYARTGVRKLDVELINAAAAPTIECRDIISSSISDIRLEPADNSLKVSLVSEEGTRTALSVAFGAVECTEYEYDGMSYANVYEKNKQWDRQFEFIFDEQYKDETEEIDVGCGYSVLQTDYCAQRDESRGVLYNLYAYEAVLTKNGREIFSYKSIGDTTPKAVSSVIRHRDGKEYFLFKESLYGLCVLDIEEQKSYHYIPAGERHDKDYPEGESFIITDIHYNPEEDLIAFGGCFWAAPFDVMIGEFSEPLNYNPHFISIHDIIDAEYEEIDDINFTEWDNGNLNCTADGKPVSVSVEMIREAIKAEKHIS